MNDGYIIDSHVHLGPVSKFFSPQTTLKDLLNLMDRLSFQFAVCTDHLSLYEGASVGLKGLARVFEESNKRIYYLGVFDPRKSKECFEVLNKAVKWPGFAGIKIHPTFHRVPAFDQSYEPIWQFASDNDLPILTHSWSISDYNPDQVLSTPKKFEKYIDKYPDVRIILAHASGRGEGRRELIRLMNQYKNVYTDIAGDIYCFRLIESLVESVPVDKILFGSDYPWIDPRSNLTRIILAKIPESIKEKILRFNTQQVFKI